jgi:hypothetical protein
MSNSFAHAAFDQRQKRAEGFCRSMHNDAEDVNAYNPNLADNPIQLDLDFGYVQGQAEHREVQTLPDLSTITQSSGRAASPAIREKFDRSPEIAHGRKLSKKKPH